MAGTNFSELERWNKPLCIHVNIDDPQTLPRGDGKALTGGAG